MTRPRACWLERTACRADIAPRETLAIMARNSLTSARSKACVAKFWSLEGLAFTGSTETLPSCTYCGRGSRGKESCGARYLIGCSSLSSQNEDEGMALYETMRENYLVEPSLRTNPVAGCGCKSNSSYTAPPRPPRLLRAYLDISGRICGPPAIDREFKTIDFLTLVDLRGLPDRVRARFF